MIILRRTKLVLTADTDALTYVPYTSHIEKLNVGL